MNEKTPVIFNRITDKNSHQYKKDLLPLKSFINKFKKNNELLSMTIPGLLFVFIFSYIPMLGIIVAFKNYNMVDGILKSPWSGFENFKFFFTSNDAFRVTRNTLLLNIIMIFTSLVFSVLFAIVLDLLRVGWFKKFAQSTMLFPYFISWVIVGFFAYSLFSYDYGFINRLLQLMGKEGVLWYNSPGYWPVILILTFLWKNTGYGTIIYLASISGINEEYYEAAKIDGANRLQEIFKITIPLLIPIISIMTLLQIGRIFYSDFGLFYYLTRDSGTLYATTDVIDTFVYRSLKVTGDIGMASAAGLYQSIVGFILVLGSNLLVKRKNPENALF